MQDYFCRDCGWRRSGWESLAGFLDLEYVRKRINWRQVLGCRWISIKGGCPEAMSTDVVGLGSGNGGNWCSIGVLDRGF